MADEVPSGSNFISSLCHCEDRTTVHVHCFCINCNGRAVNYRTQISHQKLSIAFSDTQPIVDDVGDSQELLSNIEADQGELESDLENLRIPG